MYVEDDEDTQEQFSKFLSHLSGSLVTAANGVEGLTAYSEHKPDIIITDIQMPDMSGLNMINIIRSIDESAGLIVLSAFSNTEYLMKSIHISVDAYITKPVLSSQLYDALLKCAHRLLIEKQLLLSQEILRQERQRLANVIAGTRAGTWEWNIQTGETIFNERWAELIGYTLDDISPVSVQTWEKFCHPDDLSNSAMLLEKYLLGESDYYECEARMRHKNGQWLWILDKGKVASWSEDGRPLWMYGTRTDLSMRKKTEEELRRSHDALEESRRRFENLSITDSLTEIPNRRRFDEVLAKEYARSARTGTELALILLDIDFFKSFNDCYGHVSGDDCLRQVARAISSVINRPADLAARYGGEEFVCILPETAYNGAIVIAEKIRRSIQSLAIPHAGSNIAGCVTVSLGVLTARCSTAGSPQDIVARVDELLYRAKTNGRNRVEYNKLSPGSTIETSGTEDGA